MPTGAATQAITASASAAPPDWVSLVGAIAWPAAIMLATLVLLVPVILAAFGLIEVDLKAWDKVGLTIRRPVQTPSLSDTPAAEPAANSDGASALPAVAEQVAVTEDSSGGEVDQGELLSSWNYFRAKTLDELDTSYIAWRSSIEDGGQEFWETDYRQRRLRLGADGAREDMRRIADENPTWSAPYAYLTRWALSDQDFVAAEDALQEGLKRIGSPQIGHVISSGVSLRFETGGAPAALAFCLEMSKTGIADRFKAGAFASLYDALDNTQMKDGARVALEMAIALHASGDYNQFRLAYDYADADGRWAPAASYYQNILDSRDRGAIAANNLGVLLKNIDEGLGIDYYHRGAAGEDKYAPANIANLLLEAGFAELAEKQLDSVAEPDGAAELHASARKAVLSAKRAISDKKDEVFAIVKSDMNKYRSALRRSFRHLKSGAAKAAGIFVSEDNSIYVSIEPNAAACYIKDDNIEYRGTLANEATCYSGNVFSKGTSLLGTSIISVTMLDEGDEQVSLIRWPRGVALGARIEIICLRRRQDVAQLPAPQPAQMPSAASLAAIASALAEKA